MTRWLRTHALIVVPYLLVIAVSFLVIHGLQAEGHQRCLDRQNDRQVLRQVVVVSTTSTSGGIDFTTVPGFTDLDGRTQTFLRNLTVQLTSSPTETRETLQNQMLAQLPPIDCSK